MKDIIEQTIQSYEMIREGDTVLCAVSGGADSVALTHCLFLLSKKRKFKVVACHLDHMLRGEESTGDRAFVEQFCKKLGIEIYTKQENILEFAQKEGYGIEEAARIIRYQYLEEVKETITATCVATAHTADDQLETMLFHLIRGSGTSGFRGMRPIRDCYIRPMLYATRMQVEDYLKTNNLDWREDKTNQDTVYTRNQLRLEVIPHLKKINPKASLHSARLADLMREDEEYLKQQMHISYDTLVTSCIDNSQRCDSIELTNLSKAIAWRLIKEMAKRAGNNISLEFVHVIQVWELAKQKHPSKQLNLPKGLCVYRENQQLVFSIKKEQKKPIPVALTGQNQSVYFGDFLITVQDAVVENRAANTILLDLDKMDRESFCVRSREEKDKMTCHQNSGHKTIKRLMIDRKIPRIQRNNWPILADKKGVIAAYKLGVDHGRKGSGNHVITVSFEEI